MRTVSMQVCGLLVSESQRVEGKEKEPNIHDVYTEGAVILHEVHTIQRQRIEKSKLTEWWKRAAFPVDGQHDLRCPDVG